MEHHFCRVRHDPANGQFGDCLRACIASVLSIQDPLTVPHFFHDGCDGDVGHSRMKEWLRANHGLIPFYVGIDGDYKLTETLQFMGGDVSVTDAVYMLMGSIGDEWGDHIVVCRGAEIVHDPAWFKMQLQGPCKANGLWVAVLLIKDVPQS